jgi:hypothetical protein
MPRSISKGSELVSINSEYDLATGNNKSTIERKI